MEPLERLMMLVIGIPLVSGIFSLLTNATLAERHHIHHDTYSVSKVVTRTLVLVMIFMGVLGGMTGWLCHLGVYPTDPMVPLSFFASFQLTVAAAYVLLSRTQVMAYNDRMFIRSGMRRQVEIVYADIDSMRRTPSLFIPSFHDLRIHTTQNKTVTVLGLLDIEQILMRIDRFDVLAG